MKYYIIAGEASGDMHGANLMKALKKRDTHALFRCWGGDLMCAAGGVLVKHYSDLAFMGFVEVVANLPTILNNFKLCERDLLRYQPDVLILIDYPGFNLRMAKFANAKGIKVFYYICPQIWAWHSSRAKKMRTIVDAFFVILPFEKAFYKKWHIDAHFVGHPLLDALTQTPKSSLSALPLVNPQQQKTNTTTRPIIALLPGSRQQEIKRVLPIMLSVIPHFADAYQFVIAAAPAISDKLYEQFMKQQQCEVQLVKGQTYDLLQQATAALVTSGTATLETALFKVPQVVCYKGSAVSVQIAKFLVTIKYISLVNLILDKAAVQELIQENLTTQNLVAALHAVLPNGKQHPTILADYELLQKELGAGGASEKTADLMLEKLEDF